METSFVLYFDFDEIELDSDGNIENEGVLYIAEYDEDGNFIRRVDKYGNAVEMNITVEDMEKMDYIGDGEDNPRKSYSKLVAYLEEHNEDEYEPTYTMVPYGDTWVEYWC